LLGTEVSIKVFSSSDPRALQAVREAFKEIKRIENLASFFSEASELHYLNSKAPFGPVKINDELFYLIEKGLEMSKISDGAFDITATSLGRKDGYRSIVLNKERKEIFFKDKNCKIDLGAYAKGYAVDRAIETLKAYSIKNALVDAGGDMRMVGRPFPYKEWRIGIRDPQNPKDIFKIIKINKNASIATSGNYLRKHIVSLKDRDASVLSVTVIAQTALEADLFSTTLFNMSESERLKLIKDFDNIEVLIVRKKKDGRLELIGERFRKEGDVIKETKGIK
jgi:thiamine biosynthesis lipoprotein